MIRSKMGAGFSFEAMPAEYNAWLLFRQLVDLVLFNDFCWYFLFASAYWQPMAIRVALPRYVFGMALILLNIWVKLDAHRVVQDYAWYWGDFFFLANNGQLTFDGVFELAPHPMYTLGYCGYYGVSLLSGSYTVFFVSLLAHLLQFVFLITVETPHMTKIYQSESDQQGDLGGNLETAPDDEEDSMVLFFNLDLQRSADLLTVGSLTVIFLVAIWSRASMGFLICMALGCKVTSFVFKGLILWWEDRCDHGWTRFGLRHGLTPSQVYSNWKSYSTHWFIINPLISGPSIT